MVEMFGPKVMIHFYRIFSRDVMTNIRKFIAIE